MAEHFRRIDPRYERQLDVEVVADGKKSTSKTVNISLGGLFLDTSTPLGAGRDRAASASSSPRSPRPVEVAGDVRWVVKRDGTRSGIGIRFQGLRARDVWALNQFFQTSA